MACDQILVCLLLGAAVITVVHCNSEGDALNAWKTSLEDPYNVLQSWDPTLVNPCTWFHVSCNSENSVIRLDVGNAGLSGPLVSQLGMLPNLQFLEVSGNNISGAIPTALGNLTNLVSLNLQRNRLSGVIPSSLGNLHSLVYMEVSRNNISGAIPTELGNLTNLVSLNLQRNRLSGVIPSSLGNLRSLVYMKLNSNKLSGEIPTQVIHLILGGNLRVMNVSDNMFAGTVHPINHTGFVTTKIIQDPRAHMK